MTNFMFTPAPWNWSGVYQTADGRTTWSLVGAGGYGILSCDGEANSPQGLGDEGNARLIEIAPVLLETLEGLLAWLDGDYPGDSPEGRRLRKARELVSAVKGDSLAVQCPTCGELVESVFDHVDSDCEAS